MCVCVCYRVGQKFTPQKQHHIIISWQKYQRIFSNQAYNSAKNNLHYFSAATC